MTKRAQAPSVLFVAIAVIIVLIAVAFLFYSGVLGQLHGPKILALIPVSVNATSSIPLTNMYADTPFNVSSIVSNSGNKTLDVSVLGYGCNLASGMQDKMNLAVPPGNSSSFNWTFVSPGSGSCEIQFTACFNATSNASYSLLLANPTFTGTLPTALSESSASPVSLYLGGFSGSIRAPEYPLNKTFFVYADVQGTGLLKNSSLNWLALNVTGSAYIQLARLYNIKDSSINITNAIALGQLYDSGSMELPIQIVLNPVANPPGYSQDTNITITSGYTYCMLSKSLTASIG